MQEKEVLKRDTEGRAHRLARFFFSKYSLPLERAGGLARNLHVIAIFVTYVRRDIRGARHLLQMDGILLKFRRCLSTPLPSSSDACRKFPGRLGSSLGI